MNASIEQLTQSIEDNPQPRLYLQLSDLLKQEGEMEKAVETLTTCLSVFPRYLSARIALAKLHYGQQRYEEALELAKEVLHSDPENLVALRLAADAYFQVGDHIESIKHYKRLRAINPGNPDIDAAIDNLEDLLRPRLSPRERKMERLNAYLKRIQERRGSHGF